MSTAIRSVKPWLAGKGQREHLSCMSTTLTIDPAGDLFLPLEWLAQAHPPQGATVEVDVAAAQIVVKPVSLDCLC
jgi:hypothetical protein